MVTPRQLNRASRAPGSSAQLFYSLALCLLGACAGNGGGSGSSRQPASGNDAGGNGAAGTAGGSAGSGQAGSGGAGTHGDAGGQTSPDAGVGSTDAGMDAGTSDAGSNPDAGQAGGVDAAAMDAAMDAGAEQDAAEACVPGTPTNLSSGLPKCPEAVCPTGDSVCVPNSLLENMVSSDTRARLAACDADNTCVPASYIDALNKFIQPTCRSLLGAEGRCLSRCIPQVADQASQLPQDVCGEDELCAPCYDPRTGESTHACEQGCDTGPTEPARTFPTCCDDRGFCVSPELAGDQAAQLEQGGCDDGELCAPKELTDPGFVPPSCDSTGGAEGRCLSTCVPLVASEIDSLPQASCADDERCVPCYDPRSGDQTGACTINGDEPVNPPFVFPACCDGRGLCVPPSVVGDQAASLSQQDCSADALCAPTELTDPGFIPASCSSLNDAEGRCLSTCIGGQIAAQADRLPSAGCASGEVCAPCYDPISGDATGACTINGDAPAEPAKPYARCCGSGADARGVCVPPELAGDQAAQLAQDSCADGTLCSPLELTDPGFIPASCSSLAGGEGRCLSTCLGGAVAAQVDRLPTAGCASGEVCAPCYDPITGDDTAACRINGDAPTQPKTTFTRCCDNGRGTLTGVCITPELAGDQASQLRQDTCASDELCAPIPKAEDPSYKFPSCTGLGAGACVPSCILDPLLAAVLSRTTCDVGSLCAPCTLLGSSTGACD